MFKRRNEFIKEEKRSAVLAFLQSVLIHNEASKEFLANIPGYLLLLEKGGYYESVKKYNLDGEVMNMFEGIYTTYTAVHREGVQTKREYNKWTNNDFDKILGTYQKQLMEEREKANLILKGLNGLSDTTKHEHSEEFKKINSTDKIISSEAQIDLYYALLEKFK